MSTTNIAVLKQKHAGETIYVIASGSSLDYVQPAFFADKVTIVCNEAHREWPATYVLAHHGECGQEVIDKGLTLVTSDYHCGITAWGLNDFKGEYYTYHHAEQPHVSGIDLSPILMNLDDRLVMSSCTVAEAVHFAAHLGAKAIVLCGVDGGTLDGKWNYAGYNRGAGTADYHVRLTQRLLRAVVGALRARGLLIYALNPFIDFSLEGHVYER